MSICIIHGDAQSPRLYSSLLQLRSERKSKASRLRR
jgi:hypothetical protein